VVGLKPASLTELIAFNIRNGDRVLAHFGQEIFEQAEATSGDPADPAWAAARATAGCCGRLPVDIRSGWSCQWPSCRAVVHRSSME
jgi:amidase